LPVAVAVARGHRVQPAAAEELADIVLLCKESNLAEAPHQRKDYR